ncbi:MAG: hypothetical protein DYG94_00910 [Leptolyngbya sp. PLA3]|nr:MAG: hypothetical protein EDM82_00965 [Cyanobacteria bacterium CYA]MCE7967293.1 hypothetical protein [Leptolyngbya sp. PL-A3]
MNQSPDAFNQVRAILGKLDRSITEARSRRLGKPVTEPASTPPAPVPMASQDEVPAPRAAATAPEAPASGYAKLRGQFGRAKPIAKPGNSTWPNGD